MNKGVDTIRNAYESFARKDALALTRLFDPEFEIRQTTLLPWGGTYHGFEGFTSFASKLFAHIESLPAIEEYIEAGDTVVAIGRIRGHVKASNREFDIRVVHVWTMRDGRALRFEAYIDTPAMLEALGE